jgi:hypothetical protein
MNRLSRDLCVAHSGILGRKSAEEQLLDSLGQSSRLDRQMMKTTRRRSGSTALSAGTFAKLITLTDEIRARALGIWSADPDEALGGRGAGAAGRL